MFSRQKLPVSCVIRVILLRAGLPTVDVRAKASEFKCAARPFTKSHLTFRPNQHASSRNAPLQVTV
jgi:hypothetical protein